MMRHCMSLQRYKMVVAYRGSHYHGWQFQLAAKTWKKPLPPKGEGIPTIQQALRQAIQTVIGQPVNPVGSSRTDSGVHAKGQLVHYDTHQNNIPMDGLRRAINHQLPGDILVRSIEPVPASFHAVFCTVSKRYQYLIWHDEDRSVFFNDLAWHCWKPLDIDAIRDAASRLVGRHDFASFAKPGHGRSSTVRTIHDLSISYRKPRLIVGVEGSGFLWHMVRIIVGTLLQVGLGKYTPADVSAMLDARDRTTAGSTAPPRGLYLQWIRTDNDPPTDQDRDENGNDEDAEADNA